MLTTAPNPTLDFADLWQEYHGKIRTYIRRRVTIHDSDVVDDLTADVFLKAIEAVQRGTEITHLTGYLFRAAHNRVIDHYRYQERRDKVIIDPQPSSIGYDDTPAGEYHDDLLDAPSRDLSPYEQVVSDIGCECIWAAIDRLTDKQAEIIALQAQGGYRAADLARETGQTQAAAKQLLMRGRIRLQQVLAMRGYEP